MENKYFLLRHGQTIYQKENIKKIYPTDSNDKLEITEEGKEKIKQQAEILKDKNIDLIFSSPYLRTKQTSKIVADIIGLEVMFDERLVDIKMGEFAEKPFSVYKKFFIEDKLGFKKRPKGGENWKDILERIESFLNEIEEKYQDKNILIVSHGDTLWLMAGFLKGLKTLDEFLATRKKEQNNLYPEIGDLIII
jgi:broad specificity phosphatase PhoE